MARKTKTKKATETLVTQLSEEPQPKKKAVNSEQPKKEAPKKTVHQTPYDSETSGINYSIGGFI